MRCVKRLRKNVPSFAVVLSAGLFVLAMGTAAAAPVTSAYPHATPLPVVIGALPHNLSIIGMFLQASLIVKGVIIVLLLASSVTWTVWIAKNIELAGACRSLKRAIAALNVARSLSDMGTTGNRIVDALLYEARAELEQSSGLTDARVSERIEIRLERVQAASTRHIQSGTNLLASIGATSPFVGLFGTVWGIMYSFIGISEAHTTNLMVVAPGIAEALLATAFGLIAAVPAVVIYNLFARAIAGYRGLVGDASSMIMCLAGRDIDRLRAKA